MLPASVKSLPVFKKLGGIRVIGLLVTVILPLFWPTPVLPAEYYKGKDIRQAIVDNTAIEYLDCEIIVKLKVPYEKSALAAFFTDKNVSLDRKLESHGIFRVDLLNSEEPIFDYISRIKAIDDVDFAEPNYVVKLDYIPNDPDFNLQWDMNNNGQSPTNGTADADIDAVEGWNLTRGDSSILIGILDTGIPMENGSLSHPELDNPARVIPGINLVTDGLPVDDNGHGTHVAGTIAAEGDNGIGIAGMAWDCTIMPIKVFNNAGYATIYDLLEGTIYAVDNGCRVINLSGGGGASSTLEYMVAYADSNGVVFCAAAGNDYHKAVSYPAGYSLIYDNTICVSSSDHNDASSSFSSVGPEVTVAAPGGYASGANDPRNIYSTFPNYPVYLSETYGFTLNYAYLPGTSMACPHVTALAALILSVDPTLAPDSVRRIITNTADDLGDPGFDVYFGYGRINMMNGLLQMGDINIAHEPLTDTKDSLNDFLISCAVFAIDPINPYSVLLHYSTGGSWTTSGMNPEKYLEYYSATVPAQSPGTNIEYYITAETYTGPADTTPVYSFRVIDFNPILSPPVATVTKSAGETAWYGFDITNDGIFTDQIQMEAIEGAWAADITIDTVVGIGALNPVTLAPDQTGHFYVGVDIGSSMNGDIDTTYLKATSLSRPEINCQSTFITTSLGEPLYMPFEETFESTTISLSKWIYAPGATVDDGGLDKPSEPYCLHFNGSPTGADTILSQIIDISSESSLNLVYWYERTGNGEPPDEGNDLSVEYLDNTDQWVLLSRLYGSGPDMTHFEMVSVPLPPEAYHNRFRLRFSNKADIGYRDDWFVDNISLEYSPHIAITQLGSFSVTLGPNETSAADLLIENTGQSDLIYNLEITPNFSQSEPFIKNFIDGAVEPPSRKYPTSCFDIPAAKETDEPSGLYEIIYNMGGPDQYGYIWIDSDDPSGPPFNWIDISETGQAVPLADDNYAGPLPVGFDFPYYGVGYGEFYISSNGFIGFGPLEAYSSMNNQPMPATAAPGNIIALFWDDLNLADPANPGGAVFYQTMDNKLIIQFVDVPEYGADAGDIFNAEIILFDDGRIYLQYREFAEGFDREHATVGIERVDGLDGLEIIYNGVYLKDSLSVAVSPSLVRWISASSPGGVLAPMERDTVTFTFSSLDISAGVCGADIFVGSNDPEGSVNAPPFPAFLNVLPAYTAGDANSDGNVDVGDAVFIINYIYLEGSPPNPVASGDANCDSAVDPGDAVSLINYIFKGGINPCQPAD